MRPSLYGVCVAAVDGRVLGVGDADVGFTIMSVAKPFTFALVCDVLGPDEIQRCVGVNATGLPFNSLEAVELAEDGRTNPMVNPGAIATASYAPGATAEEKWRFVRDGLSRFAGRPLDLDDEMLLLRLGDTNHRNRELAAALGQRGRLGCDPAGRRRRLHAAELPERHRARPRGDGRDARRRRRQPGDAASASSRAETCRYALAVMTTAGLYETSGDWLYDVGLPGKSGIGGGIVTVSPGKGGLGTFSPAARRGGKQRPRAARRAVPLAPARSRPVRVRTGVDAARHRRFDSGGR